jgi:formamidopyrimidine-DNA glycosylase
MPELPEVEVVRAQLLRCWLRRTITQVWVGAPSYYFLTQPEDLKKKLEKRRIDDLTRHGKYLSCVFDNGGTLLFHLGMTGQVTMSFPKRDPHVHMQWRLNDGGVVTFRDVRKFGKVEWLPKGCSSPRQEKLGPDALVIDLPTFESGLSGRKIPIKQALLDQGILAGVGNIYADEALFRAKLHPLTPALTLTRGQLKKLLLEVQKLLRESIANGGSTLNDYIHPDGELGGFQNFHHVYGKAGERCPRCKATIERVTVGGRGTHFCPRCQR